LNEMMRQFIQSYMETSNINVDIELLDLFLAEKAIYELKYELNNRPDWLDIPLTFLERL
jgi:predicted trehalose synthase